MTSDDIRELLQGVALFVIIAFIAWLVNRERLAQARRDAEKWKAWKAWAERLGLAASGGFPNLRIDGALNGVTVSFVQHVVEEPRRGRIYSYDVVASPRGELRALTIVPRGVVGRAMHRGDAEFEAAFDVLNGAVVSSQLKLALLEAHASHPGLRIDEGDVCLTGDGVPARSQLESMLQSASAVAASLT